MGGIPNSASVLRSAAGPDEPAAEGAGLLSEPFRSVRPASARANGGGLAEDSLRLPRDAAEGPDRGELPVDVGKRTPERGELARADAAPLILVNAGCAAR